MIKTLFRHTQLASLQVNNQMIALMYAMKVIGTDIDRILISHDAGWYNVGEPGGGRFRGYADIQEFLIPALLANGFTSEEIHQMTVLNPARAVAVHIRAIE